MKKRIKRSHRHNWLYKIMFDHRGADVCTVCGKIKLQVPVNRKSNDATR